MGWLVRKIDAAVLAKAEALNLFLICPFAGIATQETVARAQRVVPEVRTRGLLGETVLVLLGVNNDTDKLASNTKATGQAGEVIALIHNVLTAILSSKSEP